MIPQNNFYNQYVEIKKDKKRYNSIIGYFKEYKKAIIYIFVCILGVNISQFILPFLTQNIIDVGITYHYTNIITMILVAQVLIYLSSSFFDLIRRWLLLHINNRVNIRMVSDFLLKLIDLPIRFLKIK